MRKKTAFGAVAFATATVLTFSAFGGVAFAQGPATDTSQGQVSLVNFNAKGSITVHKFELNGKPVEASGTTTETAPVGAKPLPGAKFAVYKVQNIASQEDFKAAVEKVAADKKPAATPDGTWDKKGENPTGGDGTVKFSDLPVGLYAIYETEAPKDYVKIDPYYVFLPTTYTAADGDKTNGQKKWNYDIHTFPKDAKDVTVVKSIDDANQNVGDTIVYHIDSDIPALPKSDDYVSAFSFEDFLESENAKVFTPAEKSDDPNAADFRNKFSVEIINADGKPLQILPQDAFENPVVAAEADSSSLDASLQVGLAPALATKKVQHTTVTLNSKGLWWLTWWKQQYPTGVKVRLNLPAKVKEIGTTDGWEVNDAGVRRSIVKPNTGGYTPPTPPVTPPGNPPVPPTTPPTTPPPGTPPVIPPTEPPHVPPVPPTDTPFVPANDVETYWGKIKIVKTDAEGNKPLNGAKFKLYYCDDKKQLQKIKESDQAVNPISIKSKNEWETTNDGTAVIDGLHVNDYADSGEDGKNGAVKRQHQNYCLVETEAPKDPATGKSYELLTEPVLVKLVKADKPANAALIKSVEIKNHKSNIWQLPNTGGVGVGIMIAFGAVSVAAGVWFARRNSKKA